MKNKSLRRTLFTVGAALIVLVAIFFLADGPYKFRDWQQSRLTWIEEGHNQEATIQITPEGFVPATLTVPPGTRVYFENKDTTIHKIVANPGSDEADEFGSDDIGVEGGYAFSFHKEGSFKFHDGANPSNNGEIIVKKQ